MESGADDAEPVTPEQLADLQAGLLDDDAAARLRQRIRAEPEAAQMLAALDRVRRDVAELGTDEASAPEVPANVTTRVGAALHAARPAPTLHRLGLIIGVAAILISAVVGGVMLVRDPAPMRSTGPTAEKITVSRAPQRMPLSEPQIVELLSKPPDYGPLSAPQRLTSCLSGLGYSADTQVLGARPVDVDGRAGVLILLPSDTPTAVLALVVEPDCSSAHTGLLAHTEVTRP